MGLLARRAPEGGRKQERSETFETRRRARESNPSHSVRWSKTDEEQLRRAMVPWPGATRRNALRHFDEEERVQGAIVRANAFMRLESRTDSGAASQMRSTPEGRGADGLERPPATHEKADNANSALRGLG